MQDRPFCFREFYIPCIHYMLTCMTFGLLGHLMSLLSLRLSCSLVFLLLPFSCFFQALLSHSSQPNNAAIS